MYLHFFVLLVVRKLRNGLALICFELSTPYRFPGEHKYLEFLLHLLKDILPPSLLIDLSSVYQVIIDEAFCSVRQLFKQSVMVYNLAYHYIVACNVHFRVLCRIRSYCRTMRCCLGNVSVTHNNNPAKYFIQTRVKTKLRTWMSI